MCQRHLTIRSIGAAERVSPIVNPAAIFSLETATGRNTVTIRNASWKGIAENPKITITVKSKEKKMKNGHDADLMLYIFKQLIFKGGETIHLAP